MTRSFHNKILRVNLTEGTIRVEEPGQVYLRRYMGGWNIIADVLLKEVPAGADPLGPENKLVFAPGVLTGLAISGAARMAVGAKSPLTGAFGAAEAGGFFSSEFKRAGFDALIVEGVSPRPVYLWVTEGRAELRDASALWGQTTQETEAAIRTELGDPRVQCALIGPGGENQVTYACVMDGLKDTAGRCGLGAVMGAKRLKAVAARGTLALDGADPETVRAMARARAQQVRADRDDPRRGGLSRVGTGGGDLEGGVLTGNLPVRNFRDGEFPEIGGLSYIMDKIGVQMEGCFGCAVRCKKVVKAETAAYTVDPAYGGPEYESIGALGSTCGVSDIVAVSRANALCNAYSLDTISTGVTIAFAMECYENGLLTREDTEGIDLRFGNGDAMIAMVEKIARREGLGDLLAQGLVPAAEKIGGGSIAFAMQSKGQAYPMHEPRFKRGLAIGYAVSPTGADHCHALQEMGMMNATEEGFMPVPHMRGMGVLAPVPMETLDPDKVRASIAYTMLATMMNCVVICSMPRWSQEDLAAMVRAGTGWDVTPYELLKVGERAMTLARVFNMREGFTLEDDRLAERAYGPTRGGALADGGIDREELREALQTYYGMMGWDPETGVPLAYKLQELDVAWATEYLPK